MPDFSDFANKPLLPGATIGVFGSGQLGRMLALAAHPLGYHVIPFSPEANSPTGQVAVDEVVGAYDDDDAVRAFVERVDAVTFEFENVPASVSEIAAQVGTPVRPGGHVLHTAQNRAREKSFFAEHHLPVTPFRHVDSLETLRQSVEELGYPAIVKTASFGYDGKGQAKIDDTAPVTEQCAHVWQTLTNEQNSALVVEQFIDFDCEVSVVAARGADGAFASYPLIENIHRNHILDVSIAPARVPRSVASQAQEIARALLEALDVFGALCIEFFVTREGSVLINEIAPRPHNSGHLTIDAAITSQFEQQLRAVSGLPLGSTDLICPAVMVNLLGDVWENGESKWDVLLAESNCKLHLYGKHEARVGRKMGHFTVLGQDVEDTLKTALELRTKLNGSMV
ncbi:MAG: 5-(carboxyamino)imidazole ribonucleotide synthase [Chloroflexota bacterium]